VNGLTHITIRAAVILMIPAMCQGQLSSKVSLSNGVELQVTASLGKPTGQQILTVEMARASGDSFYRIFKDQNNLAVYAYELAVSRSADGKELHFTVKPAGNEFAAKFPAADAGKPVPTVSGELEVQLLDTGESAPLRLFEIPGMGVSVTDTISTTLNEESPEASRGQFHFAGLKVSINRMPVSGDTPHGAVSGRYAMFYIPGRGGYFFSTELVPGRAFVKSGSIDGNRMTFTVENDSYECVAAAPVLADSRSAEVWILHDPAYRPVGNWTKELRPGQTEDEFFTAASDSLNWWLP
jgi:hypothetical protein